MGEIFANPLTELAEYGDMKQDLMKGKGPVQICGVTDSQKVHVMYQVSEEKAWRLVVTHDDTRARELYDDFSYFEKNTWLYPARDLLFYSSDIHGNLLTRQRMQVFKHLMEDVGGTVVTTVDGLMDHLLPLSMMKERRILVESGEVLDIGDMKERLRDLGYERTGQVDGMGQFSIRGGIIDIFPLTEELPVRIELWGDEVDSIRSFDPESQRSITQMDSVLIYPAAELTLTKEQMENGTDRIEKEGKKQEKAFREAGKPEEAHRIKTAVGELCEALREGFDTHALDGYIRYFCKETVSFLEYMKEAAGTDRTDGALAGNGGSGERAGLAIFLDEPQRLLEKAGVVETEFRESMSHRLEKGYLLPGQTDLLFSAKAVLAAAQTPEAIFMTGLDQRLPGMAVKKKYSITGKNVSSYQNGFELLIKDLTRWKKEGYRVVLLSASRTRASRLAGDLREYDLRAFCPEDPSRPVSPGEILVTYGKLHKGFEYPLIKFVVITEGDMFGNERRQKKRKKYNYEGKKISNFSELSVGDYVVHESHGLGIYRGIEKIEQDHVIKDYIKVEYADGGNLYLLATRLDGIQKYAGADAKTPKLNKLGGAEWGKTKTLVFSDTRKPALEIIKVDAKTEEPLANAKFKITKTEDDTVSEYMTDENGKITIQDLPEGIYTVEEITAPDGYILDTQHKEIELSAGDSKQLVYENTRKPNLIITKTNALTEKPVPNTTFKVEYEGENGGVVPLGTYKTDENGQIILEDVNPGWYIITETRAAQGMSLPSNPVTRKYLAPGENAYLTAGSVDSQTPLSGSSGTGNTASQSKVTVTSGNDYIGEEIPNYPLNSLVIKKTDAITSEMLEGAAFEVRKVSEDISGNSGTIIGRYTTDSSGIIVITGLEAGAYLIEEVQAPTNYLISENSKQQAWLKADGTSVVEVTFANYPYGSLLITKVDAVTNKPLSNAKFKVTTGDGTAVGTSNGVFTTNSNGEILISNLKPDSYVVTETEAPEGYVRDTEPQTVKIGTDGGTYKVQFQNQPIGSLVILKKDADNGNPLSGAQFKVTTSKDAVVGTNNGIFTTDSNGSITITNLEKGSYIVEEVKAPDGYVLEEQSKTIALDYGKTYTLEFTNKKMTSLVVKKIDAVTGEPLPGAKFFVEKQNGEHVGEYTTDNTGTILLPTLDPDWYVVRETKAPEGYILDETPKTVEVKTNVPTVVTFEKKATFRNQNRENRFRNRGTVGRCFFCCIQNEWRENRYIQNG